MKIEIQTKIDLKIQMGELGQPCRRPQIHFVGLGLVSVLSNSKEGRASRSEKIVENETSGVGQNFILGHPGMSPACPRASARPLRASPSRVRRAFFFLRRPTAPNFLSDRS